MVIYFLFALILLYLHIVQDKKTSGIQSFLLFLTALFLCGGYMCGSDWRSYELDYTAKEEALILEPGYYFIANIAQITGIGFWEFEMLLKLFCLIVLYKYIDKHCENNKFLCMLFYFSFYAIYLFIDGPLRNLCAITIFIFALDIYDKSKFAAIAISLGGILFHSSSIIAVIYFLCRLLSDKKYVKSYIYVGLYVVAIICSFQGTLLAELVNGTTIGRLLFAEKLDRYVVFGFGEESMVSSPSSLGELLKIAFFFLVVSRRKQIESFAEGKTLFFGSMFFFIISKMGASMNVLMRFECYFSVFYAMVLTAMIDAIVPSLKKIYTISFITLSFMFTYTTVTTDYRFVPYTNYVVYVLFHQPLPSYSERYNYNYKNTPYK